MLDAFDFFLVVFCLTAIGHDFHRSDADISLSIWLTLAFRPVGAFLFGMIADRYGRRLPLMIDLVFYSIVEILTGLAPNYATFMVLRALFGIGMGGEWGVGASLAMEEAPARWRGVLSGLLQQGYASGYLLASVCFFFLFEHWGWRPLFFLGGLPALLAIFVRTRVKESEVWRDSKKNTWRELWSDVNSHWKLFAYITLLMALMNFASHGTQDMYPTFLQRQWRYGPAQRAVVTGISMLGALIGGILIGHLSDRFGRKRAIVASLAAAVAMIPLWAWAPGATWLIVGAFLMQFCVQGAWGVIPAHLAELAPAGIRGFLPGFAYQCGALISGSVVVFEALAAQRTSYANAMAFTAAAVFIPGCIVAALGCEYRGRDLRGEHK